MTEPRSATAISGHGTPATTPMPWAEASRRLAEAQTYWMATTGPDGRPHVRPVLAVWVENALHTTTSPAARKARNLAADAHCSFALSADSVDLVLEGTATRVVDPTRLQAVADAYESKYGWPPTVKDGAFDAPYGAPTAGPPPYEVYEVTPTVVYGFGTDEEHARPGPPGGSSREPHYLGPPAATQLVIWRFTTLEIGRMSARAPPSHRRAGRI